MSNQRAMKRKMAKGQEGALMETAPQAPDMGELPDISEASSERPARGLQELSPEKKNQIRVTNAAITDLIYDERTQPEIQKMLSRGEPAQTVPEAVNTVFMKFEGATRSKGPMPLDVKLAAGVHTFSEIMEVGEGLGVIPPDLSDEQMQPILRETIQKYIQRGLKEKTIDPIELQQRVEPLMTEQENMLGSQMGKQHGVPGELQPAQSNLAITERAQAPLKLENAQLKKGNKKMQGALQGIASQPEGN